MQSARENEVVLSTEEEMSLGAALTELKSLGFIRFRQNLRLLKKTNGDLAAVREYLLAKKKFREAKMERKRCGKEDKKEKKFHQKEWKLQRKEWKSCAKEWKREGKKSCFSRRCEASKSVQMKTEDGAADPVADANVDARTLASLSVWPQQVTRLYLDGNNMLYVAAPLRAKAIRRHDMSSAGVVLSSVAFEFTKLLPASVKTTMVFDSARESVLQSYSADNFQILSARPAFATSDDALVHWAMENAADGSHPVLSMVVTSDRGLQKRLAAVSGVVLVKPKVWMEYAATMLEKQNNNGAQVDIHLDEWMALWIKRMEEESLADHLQSSLTVSNAN